MKNKQSKSVGEGLDANQRRVGQLGPTEKVGKKGAVGKLVGASESIEESELTEEQLLAKKLMDEWLKSKDEKPKDRGLSKKPIDREIQKKVGEGRAMGIPVDVPSAAKKLTQYINRNFEDLASMTSFYADRKQEYREPKLDKLFKTADGTPIPIVFNMGGELKLYDQPQLHLNIPIGTYWMYKGLFRPTEFVQKLIKLMSDGDIQEKATER